jgi:NAD(P)-dependent dehydrogenase (short-subunit alcohol dehydrogenase family)
VTGRLEGRNVLITGASRGIGAAVAHRFAAEGANLAITARTLDHHPTLSGSLNETAERCREFGASVTVIVADLAEATSRINIIEQTSDALGSIHVLVNNAAAAIYKGLDTYSLKHRRLMTEVNVQAPIDLIQAVVPNMIANGEGWVVNLSSASKHHPLGPPYNLGGVRSVYGFYGATKAMLDRATTALASELFGTGIRINTIEPRAAVLSEGADAVVGEMLQPEQIESMEAMIEAILFLATCPEKHTGMNEISLALLERNQTIIMDLDGQVPHPGGQRP